jgi:diguanylate cyclase (GGDEF)-like protein
MPLALLFLDIDGFKSINDAYGHHVGDVALRTIAQRLAASIRRGDLAGRLGGDEFVVVAEPVADLEEAVALSNRILEVVTAPITFEGITITPSASIGIGLADGTLTADELLRDADLAVYRAKSLGKGRVDVCDEDLRNEVQERSSLEHALRAALANDEFVMFYQPTIDPRSRDITSLEALIRWDRPGVGIVGPDQFIPTAERSDLILDIDRWVLRQVAAQLAEWGGRQTLRALPVAVNISGRHLGSGTLLHDVESALAGHDVDHHLLIVEVTETALFEDMATAARELTQLRATGVRIALDDFGTGYMSLSHLRALPVDILKIDRSFVASMASDTEDSLIRLIVDTGHLLGAVVTAEGVETEMQAQQLTEMGNDFLQGYLFSRPVDAATTTRTLERQAESDRAVSPT